MKLQPSATMTVDTLAAEIRRQADYHAAQAYPFPALSIDKHSDDRSGRYGQIDVLPRGLGSGCSVRITLVEGTATVRRISLQPDELLAVSVTEWSAALHAIGPFLPADTSEAIAAAFG